MTALKQAGTRVYEPIYRFRLEIPADTLGPVLPALGCVPFPFDCDRPVGGTIPTGLRSDRNPLNCKEYPLHLVRRV